MKLNELKPNDGAKKKRQRVGRGIAAGKGKTSGRGTKGEGARAGKGGHLARQGGNLPFFRSMPFMRGEGFTPPNQVEYNEVTLTNLSRFAADTQVTPELLQEKNMLHKKGLPVVILGSGELKIPLKIKAHRVTKGAKAKIEAAGGKVELIKS
jgi:large subunit ribosomal protein L15